LVLLLVVVLLLEFVVVFVAVELPLFDCVPLVLDPDAGPGLVCVVSANATCDTNNAEIANASVFFIASSFSRWLVRLVRGGF